MEFVFLERPHSAVGTLTIRGKPCLQRVRYGDQSAGAVLGLAGADFDLTAPSPNVGPFEATDFGSAKAGQTLQRDDGPQVCVGVREQWKGYFAVFL